MKMQKSSRVQIVAVSEVTKKDVQNMKKQINKSMWKPLAVAVFKLKDRRYVKKIHIEDLKKNYRIRRLRTI